MKKTTILIIIFVVIVFFYSTVALQIPFIEPVFWVILVPFILCLSYRKNLLQAANGFAAICFGVIAGFITFRLAPLFSSLVAFLKKEEY